VTLLYIFIHIYKYIYFAYIISQNYMIIKLFNLTISNYYRAQNHSCYIVVHIKRLCQFIKIECGFVCKQLRFSRSKHTCRQHLIKQSLIIPLYIYDSCSSGIDVRAEKEILTLDTMPRITVLHLLIVIENSRLQRPAHR